MKSIILDYYSVFNDYDVIYVNKFIPILSMDSHDVQKQLKVEISRI